MPTFYNFRQDGLDYSFDDIFVPADLFREGNLWVWGLALVGNNTAANVSTPVTTFAGGTNWKQASAGDEHFAAIKTDGTLWTWGVNSNGRLGTNDTTIRSTPVTTFAGGNNWKQVVACRQHCAAIKTDGTLWTWGVNSNGQLGTNDTTIRSTPVTTFAGGTNWKQVIGSKQSSHMAAIKTDGTLWTWGQANVGQLGNGATTGSISTPVTTFAGGNNWKQVSVGSIHTQAIKTDGTLWVWGYNLNGNLGNASTTNTSTPVTTFAGGNNWKQVSSGNQNTAAIKTDGTLWVWGNRTFGQLGNTNRIAVTTTSGSMSASSNVITGISTSGLSLGDPLRETNPNNSNINGSTITNIGTGTVTLSSPNGATSYTGTFTFTSSLSGISTPITTFAGGTNWKQVSVGEDYMAAIKTDGTLWTWGTSGYAQLGNGLIAGTGEVTVKKANFSRSTPVTTFAGGTNWRQLDAGSKKVVANTYIDPVI